MERRLSAILAADMVGYSRLMEAEEIGTIERQKIHRRELIDPSFEKFHGRIVKEMGDGVLVEFPSAVEAVQCAVEIQRAMPERESDVPEDRKIIYRIGINLGDIIIEDEDVFGSGVNIASRLEQLAKPGGICISGTTYDHLKAQVEAGYEALGEVHVKNIEQPVRAYRVLIGPDQVGTLIEKTQKPASNRTTFAIALSISLLAMLIGGWWWAQSPAIEPVNNPKVLSLPDKPSIAILPFANLSDDMEQEYFADGFTEDLITNLAQSKEIFVTARNSAFTYKNKMVKVQAVAGDLGVRYVLEGSVRRVSSKIRITAQLIDARDGAHVWAKQYDEPIENFFDIQDALVREIAGTLLANIKMADLQRSRQKRPSEMSAHDYVLQARARYARRGASTLLEARTLAQKAIEIDPKYAPAFAILADTYNSAYILQLEGSESLERAYTAARKAFELDPYLSEAHELLGRVLLRQSRFEEAILSFKRSIELNPNRADNYASLADTLTFANRADEAIEFLKIAMRLDPFYSPRYDMYLGRAHYFVGRYNEAISELKNCAVRAPKYRPCYMYLAPAYAEAGMDKEAREAVRTLLEISPDFSISNSVTGHLPFVAESLNRYVSGLRKAGVPE